MVEGIDVRALPIGPAEAFVLSRVDGACTRARNRRRGGDRAQRRRGHARGAGALGRHLVRSTDGQTRRLARAVPSRTCRARCGSGRSSKPTSALEPQHPAAALYDARDLDEEVDIELERKRTILDAFHRLDSLTHYQILRVDPSADKRAIKNAYFEIVNVFHPDRYFGKKLGSFKPKLERVFARLTEAHDALTRSGPRAEYDAYLASLDKTRQLDQAASRAATRKYRRFSDKSKKKRAPR